MQTVRLSLTHPAAPATSRALQPRRRQAARPVRLSVRASTGVSEMSDLEAGQGLALQGQAPALVIACDMWLLALPAVAARLRQEALLIIARSGRHSIL